MNIICAHIFIIFDEVDYGCLEDYFGNLENYLFIASQEFSSKADSSDFTPCILQKTVAIIQYF